MSEKFSPIGKILEAVQTTHENYLMQEVGFQVDHETGDIVVIEYDMESTDGEEKGRYLVRLSTVKVQTITEGVS